MASILMRITIQECSGSIKIWLFSLMGLTMKESGTLKQSRDMVEGTKYGAMAAFMKVIGKVIKQMAVVGLSMPMETYMMATGKTIRLTALVSIPTLMVLSMKATG